MRLVVWWIWISRERSKCGSSGLLASSSIPVLSSVQFSVYTGRSLASGDFTPSFESKYELAH